MEPTAIHHVAINVTDVDEAVAFYCDVLGFKERSDRPDLGFGGAWLDAGGQQLHLIQAEPPESRGQHFAIQVGDIEAAIAELRRKGLNPSEAAGIGPSLQAFVADPSGNVIELHQPG